MIKTIQIKDDVHSRLGEHGSKNETYEDIIVKLLDFYEKNNKKKV